MLRSRLDPARLASFWSALLDIAVTREPKTAKVRIHLDIQVDDIGAARRQVEDLGGCWSGERHDYDDGIVLVMHDPVGVSRLL